MGKNVHHVRHKETYCSLFFAAGEWNYLFGYSKLVCTDQCMLNAPRNTLPSRYSFHFICLRVSGKAK